MKWKLPIYLRIVLSASASCSLYIVFLVVPKASRGIYVPSDIVLYVWGKEWMDLKHCRFAVCVPFLVITAVSFSSLILSGGLPRRGSYLELDLTDPGAIITRHHIFSLQGSDSTFTIPASRIPLIQLPKTIQQPDIFGFLLQFVLLTELKIIVKVSLTTLSTCY